MRRIVPTFLAFLALCLAPVLAQFDDLANPGPYAAGWTRVAVARGDGSTFTALLFYPAAARGQDQAFVRAGAPYPAVTFGHGFLQVVTRYQSTLEHLATHGYFSIASESQGGLFPDHDAFAEDLRHCLTYLEVENTRVGSRFEGGVAVGRYGASGHSMGGGASLLATARDPRIRAVATLAAAETDPSAIAAMRQITVPVRLIAGSSDTITPPSRHQQPMYDAGGPPRQLPILQGGWHCGFQDSSVFGCDSGSMPRATQLAYTRRLLTGFFNLYLKGDQRPWSGVWGPALAQDGQVRTQSDPGIVVAPADQVVEATPGQSAKFVIDVANAGRAPTAYTVLTEGVAWRIARPAQTKVLAVGEAARVSLSAMVPLGTPAGDYAGIVSVRSESDRATRQWARVVFLVP